MFETFLTSVTSYLKRQRYNRLFKIVVISSIVITSLVTSLREEMSSYSLDPRSQTHDTNYVFFLYNTALTMTLLSLTTFAIMSCPNFS